MQWPGQAPFGATLSFDFDAEEVWLAHAVERIFDARYGSSRQERADGMAERGEWHPILAAVEGPTGVWRMVDAAGRDYGRVEIRRVMNGAEPRYKVSRYGDVIGWATSLREACAQVHQAYLRAHGPSGEPMADWGTSWRSSRPPPS